MRGAGQIHDVAERPSDAGRDANASAGRRWLLISGVFLAAQVAATDYGAGVGGVGVGGAAAVCWFVLGAALLWLVYRRGSLIARRIVGQAVPRLTEPVRRHVQAMRQ